MINLKYVKRFSFSNKNSEANQAVIDKLTRLGSQSQQENSMRIHVFRNGTFEFPYVLTINRKEINENAAMIEIIVRVQIFKLIILNAFSAVLVSVLLYFAFESYWVLFPALFYSLIYYQIVRKEVLKFTEKLVNSWFEKPL